MLAIQTFPTLFEADFRAPDERLDQYAFLRRLPAGLRAEIWLGLPAGGSSLAQLVAIKVFFPHLPGPTGEALSAELALAARLGHPNIVRAQRFGWHAERPFIVSEYLEGTTLRALLHRVSVARASVAAAAVVRVLLGIVRAVCHAERRAASPTAMGLVRQTIAADDVFVTFDGAVKVLGFKAGPGAERTFRDSEARWHDSSAHAAIDALLSEHLTPELRRVLAAATRFRGCGLHGLERAGRALRRWQAEVLGSNGRAELAELMGAVLPWARFGQRAELERRLGELMSSRSVSNSLAPDADEGSPPASGFRKVPGRNDAHTEGGSRLG